jgi:beta-N-acetylhexosaminidase
LPRAENGGDVAAKAFISGCESGSLTVEERRFFAEEGPWGLILFRRNCQSREQVRDLVGAFRDLVGRPDAPVLIDQEGGRVQRLGPPAWPAYPPGGVLGRIAESNREAGSRAAWLHGRLIADDLHAIGINVDCLPVLDVIAPDVSQAIGDRSFGGDPRIVTALGRSVANGLLDGGVLPVAKHIPGHGRATSDSHFTLPVVDAPLSTLAESDFVPFASLADLPLAMTSHVVYTAVDRERPGTTSAAVIRDIIRGRIGFDGLLMSDDVSMDALSGDYVSRARAIYAAGCDLVLHCKGRIEEMRTIALVAPPLAGPAGERAARALSRLRPPKAFDRDAARQELLALAARAGWLRMS